MNTWLKMLSLIVVTSLSTVLKAEENFVGCAPSAAECRNSCSDHIGRAEPNAAQCRLELASWGCFCGTPEDNSPVTIPESFAFIGCRPSARECLHSCPTRSFIAQKSPEMCNSDYELEPFACFCEL